MPWTKPLGACATLSTLCKRGELCADDRYTPELARNLSGLADAERLPYYEATFHINRLYARRHGYAFMYGQRDDAAERHMSWMKLPFIREKLECCCQWALWMDSDSYLVMQGHELSLEAWLANAGLSTERMTLVMGNMLPVAGWREGADPVAMIGLNEPWQESTERFCASNMLFTRTKRTLEVLDYWYNATVLYKDLARYKTEHSWEQVPLNHAVMLKYNNAFAAFPRGQVQGEGSDIIRHLHHQYGEKRTASSVQHLLGVLRSGS